jgi:hypothetical protein
MDSMVTIYNKEPKCVHFQCMNGTLPSVTIQRYWKVTLALTCTAYSDLFYIPAHMDMLVEPSISYLIKWNLMSFKQDGVWNEVMINLKEQISDVS